MGVNLTFGARLALNENFHKSIGVVSRDTNRLHENATMAKL